ncbi:MAG: Stp1/IreP family PP2C-type Ser/Thr phosphatase [Clostridiales bacterium]|nr:Stp1/IreP family PP2C-type Ser/Thr phosphatase [Clostridiales bacterium]
MSLTFTYAAKTDKGKLRKNNEDSYGILTDTAGVARAFLVADGMGGHKSGELASSLAISYISEYIGDALRRLQEHNATTSATSSTPALAPSPASSASPVTAPKELMIAALKHANMKIMEKSYEHPDNSGMGTTIVAALISGDWITIAHAGDSRAYLIRNGMIKSLTNDHSLVQELLQNGSLTEDEVRHHPGKNVVTRALGCMDFLDVDIIEDDILPGDVYILCTDGLTGMLLQNEILNLYDKNKNKGLKSVCNSLIDAANIHGGNDNITVLLLQT